MRISFDCASEVRPIWNCRGWLFLLLVLVAEHSDGSSTRIRTTEAFSVEATFQRRWTPSASTTKLLSSVGTSPPTNQMETNTATTTKASATAAASVYPTARGSEVDARKIVASGRQHLEALLVSHCLFATEALAEESLLRLRTAQVDFETLASSLSACTETREERGLVGWVNLQRERHQSSSTENQEPSAEDINEHLDGILPKQARDTLIRMVTKPVGAYAALLLHQKI